LFTALDLVPNEPFEADHCGTCTRCLDACPTHAFAEPHVLNATKCISYLTIEHRSAIPEAFRPNISESVFGCDICQDVCPWNEKFSATTAASALAPRADLTAPDLVELLNLDDEGFRARFRGTAVTRAKRRGLARNVAVAMGNSGDRRYVPALEHAVAHDPEPLVREHAQWALDRLRDASR
jgi:epoxyqueuosine reductase